MSADVSRARVPGTPPVYLLGCLESRVTIYSQQVRAIELARHLLDSRAVRESGRVAVVGAGIGGLTLAAMLAVAAPELRVVIFEGQDEVLHLQSGARDRYVHPHIFDWPVDSALQPRAGLPLMDWAAGTADGVAADLHSQFEEVCRRTRLEVRTSSRVDGLQSVGPDLRLVVEGTPLPDEYESVVLCIGFGYERRASLRNPSYWSPSPLPARFLSQVDDDLVFISGNGDGGLADFALAAFKGLTHEVILTRVLEHADTAALLPLLRALDDLAWSDPSFDLLDAYRRQLKPVVGNHLIREVRDMLRPKGRIILHTHHAQLLRRETALLNRLVAFLAIDADETYARGCIATVTGVPVRHLEADSDAVDLADGQHFKPSLRLLRFGPDTQSVQRPFADEFARWRDVHGAALGSRPVDPVLSDSTRQWAKQAMRAAGLQAPSPQAQETGPPQEAQPHDHRAVVAGGINVIGGNVGAGAVVTQVYSAR